MKTKEKNEQASSKMLEQIEQFYGETGIKLEIRDGHPYFLGDLDLRYSSGATISKGVIIGGSLFSGSERIDMSGKLTQAQRQRIDEVRNMVLRCEHSGKTYIKVDGILSEIIKQRGNLYITKKIYSNNLMYVITDGQGNWAHGDSLPEAKQDLLYKISDRDASSYKHLTVESGLSTDEAIVCYRVITGSCSAGVRDYLTNRLPQPQKKHYTIAEIIELTKGEYGGATFAGFFQEQQPQAV